MIVIGNNNGDTYFAIKDDGTHATLLDTLAVDAAGSAKATPTLSADGLLYIPARMMWMTSNGDGDSPTFAAANLYNAFDLNEGAQTILPPPGPPSGPRSIR